MSIDVFGKGKDFFKLSIRSKNDWLVDKYVITLSTDQIGLIVSWENNTLGFYIEPIILVKMM